ncbi:hypothetical protein [Sessilibacter corallicola]|uniref:hypothetical protein n=1 Tax=Sessilibacter corallicola TaxID=2904075 RepID=UPI001E5DA5A1|nr:hypothetical protein [Sessilibacter corallicola]MCE2029453.1 hypothetical protein [Sessilibacter corallicola]
MSSKNFLVWIPTFIGIILLGVSQIDLHLFKEGIFEVRTILGWELVLVISGLLSGLAVLFIGVRYLFKKAWFFSIQSFLSVLGFIILFVVGGMLGGAYLNAT